MEGDCSSIRYGTISAGKSSNTPKIAKFTDTKERRMERVVR
jgi:hypothetical protein